MSKELKLEKLEDLLHIDENSLKAPEAKAVIKKAKQMMKTSGAEEKVADEEAKELPYEAVSVVGKKFVKIKFDLNSKEARVVETLEDSRDKKGRNHMATFKAVTELEKLAKSQKGE